MSRALISKRFTQSLFYVAHSNRLNLSFSVFFIEIASVFGSKVMGKRSTDKKIFEIFLGIPGQNTIYRGATKSAGISPAPLKN